MKKIIFISISLLLGFIGNSFAQTSISYGPYSYTYGNNNYNISTTFITQTWGETYLLVTLTNTGSSAINLSGGSEVWFNGYSTPTIINYPTLGGLSYPSNAIITNLPRGTFSLLQTKILFPNEPWATTALASGNSFSINYSLGSNTANSNFQSIAQSCRLYGNGWVRPNLFVPLTINITGNQNVQQSVVVNDKTTTTKTTYRINSSATINVYDGDSLALWGNDTLVGNTLYHSTYTAQSPLLMKASSSNTDVTLPYTFMTIPTGTMTIQVAGLPTGASTKLLASSSTYPIIKEISIVNGLNAIASIPFDTYTISVNRYANEATNSLAVPTYTPSYSFANASTSALNVTFTPSIIKPFGIDGWAKYLSMGGITLGDAGNDLGLSQTPLNAIFKYSGSGLGDTGILLDDSSPNFPTTKTIQQARRLEANYATLYPNFTSKVMPVMVHYTAQASGGGIGEIDVYNDTNLQIHYRNLIRETKKMMSFRDATHPFPATYVLNPDLLGAQQQSYSLDNFNDNEIYNHLIQVNGQLVSALLAEGLSTASLPVFTNNWLGYYQSINYLIKTIGEGAIKFGWQLNVWATGTSLWVYDANNLASVKAQQVTSFVNDKLGVFSGTWKPDFVVLDRYEADCFSVRGQNYAYNTQAWDRFVDYSAEIGKNLNLPVMLWQIPGGHLITNNETIMNYDIPSHSSASATYFLGDKNVGIGTNNVRSSVLSLPLLPISSVYNTTATTIGQWLNQTPNYDYGKSQLQKLADKNIFSILWGGGETISVATIGTNGNDDGWLANKLKGYYDNGKVYQIQTTPCPTILTLTNPANNISNGMVIQEANGITGSIIATNQITGTADVIYRAGRTINLNPGFKVDAGTVFKTAFGGCN